MPTLPPRLELVLLLSAAATGYNLTMQILPGQRIDLAQVDAEERVQASETLSSSGAASVSSSPLPISPAPVAVMEVAVVNAGGTCAIPLMGGPALNERFEPC